MEKEEFQKRFPSLAKEMEERKGKADLNLQVEKPKPRRKFAGYDPDILDFLRRCSTDGEALEIIEYLKMRGEIALEEANCYKKKLAEEGLGSFGSKKDPGYYEREG